MKKDLIIPRKVSNENTSIEAELPIKNVKLDDNLERN